ncbi:FecR family protein [Flavivirga amylovorans]|uniref:FecR family protein n=1 Tax=Flavivirga amylovorans TaxID=870486 RepID=A0ABT8X193_9FLAO|nr:FecR family protein [Flavivirga amylovorans]MDO5987722.1 FecR family protein [Flavivirga amylovorans]
MKNNKSKDIKNFLNFEFSSEEEKETFKKSSKTYSEYKEIIELFDNVKPLDYNEEVILEQLDHARLKPSTKKQQVIPLYKKWMPISISATVLLFVSVALFNIKSNLEHHTLAGESVQISLPDASKVWLNAKSNIAYNKAWEKSRAINLKGEAYFEVAKGETFTVKTPQGIVTVLGTKFNVKQRDTSFEVYCYEGTVAVMYKGKETILKANNFFNSKTLDIDMQKSIAAKTKPNWIENVSIFENTPIYDVVSDISIQYDIEFDINSNLNKDLKYTGSYHYDDTLETVLSVFCESLDLEYVKKGKSIYLNKK